MARNRMIRPEFWEDSKIHKLTAYARLLFIAMWNFADDEGYLPHDLEWLKAKCFPYDTVKLDKLLGELFDLKRIETKNGIILIKNFLKYQKINRPFPSALKQQFSEHSVNTHEPFSDHSSHKEKLSEVKLIEEKLIEGFQPTTKPSRFQQPTAEEVTEYAQSIGFRLDGGKFCDYYASKGWLVGKAPMKDWKAAVRTWKSKENESTPAPPKPKYKQITAAEWLDLKGYPLSSGTKIDGYEII